MYKLGQEIDVKAIKREILIDHIITCTMNIATLAMGILVLYLEFTHQGLFNN